MDNGYLGAAIIAVLIVAARWIHQYIKAKGPRKIDWKAVTSSEREWLLSLTESQRLDAFRMLIREGWSPGHAEKQSLRGTHMSKHEPVANRDAEKFILKLLSGRYVHAIRYHIGGPWTLSLTTERGELDIQIETVELRIPEQAAWTVMLLAPPFNLQFRDDIGDTTSAIALFNLLNIHALTDVKIRDDGTLVLGFEGGRVLEMPGIVEPTDDTWSIIRDPHGSNVHLMRCYFGKVFADPDLL